MDYRVAVLAGDGIGPEVMQEALVLIEHCARKTGFAIKLNEYLVGGVAFDETGSPLPEKTLNGCRQAEAILFGSVGGSKWEHLAPELQPERGALLPLRKTFNLFANLRPGICLPALSHTSPIKTELIPQGFDVLCIRELTGGLYFGQPKKTEEIDGELCAIDTMIYKQSEIERIAHIGFQAAQKRDKRLVSVDKANVLQNSILWRKTVIEIAKQYPDVELSHLYVDNAAMQLVKRPSEFDVLLTENLFGDILSDEMAMISGSLGMLPSASLGEKNADGTYFGLYEPSGGSAPDIAGQGIANPIAQILSVAMMFRFSFDQLELAKNIEDSVAQCIEQGLRTADIYTGEQTETKVSTSEMGAAIRKNLN